MTSEPTPKVRLVKCPKCRNILAEVAGIPLYKCGGCSTVLQAKSWRNAISTGSGLPEASAELTHGSDHVSKDRESERLNWSTLDGSDTVNLPEKAKENGGKEQNNHEELKGRQHGSLTSEYEGKKNSESIQNQPQEVKCDGPEANLPCENKENGSYQAEYEEGKRECQEYFSNDRPRAANPSLDMENNARVGYELKDFRADGNEQKVQNKLGDFEGEQHGSMTSEGGGEKNYRSDISSPQEVKNEGPEVAYLSGKDRENGSDQCEYREFSGECQGYIHNEHPRVATSSTDREENECVEHELRECNNGGSDQNRREKFEGEQHESVASEEEGIKIYRSDESNPQDFSSEDRETGSDQDKYGECSTDCGGDIHDDHVRVANPSSDGKENESDEHELGDCKLGLLKEFDDVQHGVEHSLGKGNNDWGNQSMSDYCNTEHISVSRSANSRDVNLKFEDKKNTMNQIDFGNCEEEQLSCVNELTSHSESAGCGNEEKPSTLGGVSEEDTNSDASFLAGSRLEAKAKGKCDIHLRKLSADNLEFRREIGLPVTAKRQPTSSTSSGTLLSFPSEELEQSPRRVHSRIRSVETVASAEYGDHSSEFSNYLGDPAKDFHMAGSHVYDGSVSSYDGTEYNHNTYEDIPSRTKLQSDKHFVNTRMNKSLEMQRLTRNSMSISFEKNPYSMRRRLTYDGLPEPARHHHPVGHLIMPERENYPYRSPFYQKGVLSGYESGGPSEFQSNTSRYSPGNPNGPEQERLKLLQLVYELLDQLNKTPNLKEISGEGISREDAWRGRNIPMYSRQGGPEGQNLVDFCYQSYPERHSGGSNLMKEHKVSHIPYLGQATHDRRYTNHPFPADWRYSAPLHSSIPNQNNGLRSIRPGSYSPYSSHVSSPAQFMDSRFPLRSSEVLSDEEIRANHITDKHSKEKHLSDMRHFLPTAGGAPFVTCHRCLNLLQLPAEFLLYKGKLHRIKCGSCSELLKFSLQNKGHLVQCTEYMDSPTNGLDELINETNRNNVASTSHGNDIPQIYPPSGSVDYGNSLRKSCSTEDAVPAALQSLQEGKAFGSKFSNKNSLEPKIQPSNSIRKEFENKHTITSKSSGVNPPLSSKPQSEKTTPENEEIPASSSPLHKLMGYSSPIHVIHGSGTSTARETSPDEHH